MGAGVVTGAETGASESAGASVGGTRGGEGAGAGASASARTGAGPDVGGTDAGASGVDVESRIGWVDTELDVREVMVVESVEDVDKLGRDIPGEEVVMVGEVDWAGADGTDAVTCRLECCVDGGGDERGHTAEATLLRDTVDWSCSKEDEIEVE